MSDHESDSDCTIEPEEVVVEENVVEPEPPKKTKAKPRAKPVKKIKPDKQEYDGEDEASPEEETPKKKPRGRPKKPEIEKAAKQVVVKEKVIYMVPNEKKEGSFKKIKNPTLGVRAMKKLELEAEKEKKELELGKALVVTKKGKIDKRSTTRTPAQIAATARLVEANKLRREAAGKLKAAEKKEEAVNKKIEQKEIVKESLREVISEPEPYYKPKEPIAPDPYGGLQF